MQDAKGLIDMWEIGDVKARGRAAFKANYWVSVVVGILLMLLVGGSAASGANNARQQTSELTIEQQTAVDDATSAIRAMPDEAKGQLVAAIIGGSLVATIVGVLLKVFLFNPLQVGCYRFFAKNVEQTPAPLGLVREGFGGYGHVFMTLFLRDLFLVLWCLLLIVPGIIKSYSYQLVPYIIKDQPNLSATETIARSSELMRGNKWRAFVMDLTFLGWWLLGGLTLGVVNVFWTTPYYESAKAALYLELTGR